MSSSPWTLHAAASPSARDRAPGPASAPAPAAIPSAPPPSHCCSASHLLSPDFTMYSVSSSSCSCLTSYLPFLMLLQLYFLFHICLLFPDFSEALPPTPVQLPTCFLLILLKPVHSLYSTLNCLHLISLQPLLSLLLNCLPALS
jgi:hypothetical protein